MGVNINELIKKKKIMIEDKKQKIKKEEFFEAYKNVFGGK